jgi:hypothetical protein
VSATGILTRPGSPPAAGHRRAVSTGDRRAVSTGPRWGAARAIPVALVLAIQVILSLRLLYATTASGDEAIYIYTGHQLIHELWHGGGSPWPETWLSGAPVIYPILAAMVDHLGGLTLVRLMSLGFMLTATWLLFASTRRLFGYWPAVAAAGMFASLGLTQSLGVYATYDAMALMLTAFAAYCAIRAADSSKWLILVPLAIFAANATKYATILFDPVIIGLAALMLRDQGWRKVLARAGVLALVTILADAVAVLLAGTAYWDGIAYTTVARKAGTGILNLEPATAHSIILYSWGVIGLVVLLGLLGIIAALLITREWSSVWLLAVLTMAGMLVTVEALHVHDLTSVNKHDDFGIWFTCIPAGYTFARAAELAGAWYKRIPLIALALASVGTVLYLYGAPYPAGSAYGDNRAFAPVASYLKAAPGKRYLLGGRVSRVILYDYRLAIPWQREVDDDYVKYPIPGRGGDPAGTVPGLICSAVTPGCMYLTGPAAAKAAIRAHWFALISFVGQNNLPIDVTELATVRATPGYHLVSTVGGDTFIYAPDYPKWEAAHRAELHRMLRHRHRQGRRHSDLSRACSAENRGGPCIVSLAISRSR